MSGSGRPSLACAVLIVCRSRSRFASASGDRSDMPAPPARGPNSPARADSSRGPMVTPRTPPTLLIHTQADAAVPVENSILFYQALWAQVKSVALVQ